MGAVVLNHGKVVDRDHIAIDPHQASGPMGLVEAVFERYPVQSVAAEVHLTARGVRTTWDLPVLGAANIQVLGAVRGFEDLQAVIRVNARRILAAFIVDGLLVSKHRFNLASRAIRGTRHLQGYAPSTPHRHA